MRWLVALTLAMLACLKPAMAQDAPPTIALVSIHVAELPADARAAARRMEGTVSVDLYGLGGGLVPSIEGVDLGHYDLVLLDAPGPRAHNFAAQIEAAKVRTKLLVVGAGTPIVGNIDPKAHPDVARYWNNATQDNYAGLFSYIAAQLLGRPVSVPPPVEFPSLALWHPEAKTPFTAIDDYLSWEEARFSDGASRPLIGILFYRSLVLADNAETVAALIREVERQGGLPIPIWREGSRDRASRLLGGRRIDALILCANRLNYADADAGVDEAERLGVPPLMCAIDHRRDAGAWRKSLGGFAPDSTGELALSELEGIVEPMVVGARTIRANGTATYAPIVEQVRWRVARAMAWAHLHRLPNSRKRIVIPYHNEEPGEADIGSDPDSYLDAQGSVLALLHRLRAERYDTGTDPIPDRAMLARHMAEAGSNVRPGDDVTLRRRIGQGAASIPLATYLGWYAQLPRALRDAVEARWGPPPGRIMVVDGRIVIPVLRFGKVTLAPHPLWGPQADPGALAEKGALPPHHQYLAFYLWMQHQEHADAFLPMFTQLSLMPGKQEGPAATDAVGQLIGALPHIQPLPLQANGGVGNKRRTQAVTVGFMPEFVRAGLSPGLAQIETLLDAQPIDETKLRAAAIETNLAGSLELDPQAAPVDALVPALRAYLAEARAAPMPLGGHVLGEAPDASTAARIVQAMLAGNRVGAAPVDRVERAIAGDEEALEPSQAVQARDYASRLASAPRELDAVIAALGGRYVPPGPMQDVIRNPDALPAGRNPYTLDVRAIPTPAAWETGVRLADETLEHYHEKHGRLPRKLAFVLWSNETAQNGGSNEAQIFRLLGVRPVWNARGQVADVVLVDRTTLGRPRVDVLVTTSGTYRDHFGEKLALIAKAVKLATDADEPDNPVRKETLARAAALVGAGVDPALAERRALRRIFSTAPGAYSPSTQFANREGWSPQRLNRLYQARLGHAYGDGSDGEADADAFTANLKHVDAAVFSRSSSAYGLLDTPMPAAYLGGLSMAVREDSGRTIEAYVVNEQVKGEAKVETLERFYGRERDSRYLNPAWIRGMQASGYNGARYVADLADSMLLWDQTRPELVADRDWDAVRDVYLHDRYKLGMNRFFAENNPAARVKLVQTMLDAIDRGAWRADAATRAELAKIVNQSPPVGQATVPRSIPAAGLGRAPTPSRLRSQPVTAGPSASRAVTSVAGYELVRAPVAPQIVTRSAGLAQTFLAAVLVFLLAGGAALKPRW